LSDDEFPPQDCFDDRFKRWRREVKYQRKSDLRWLDKLIFLTEAEYLSENEDLDLGLKQLSATEKEIRANVRWYFDLQRWKHDLIRWEREDLEWERKLQSGERAASRETTHARKAQQDRRNNESPIRTKKNRQHRRRKPKLDDQGVS
jgi:hypothetical protein